MGKRHLRVLPGLRKEGELMGVQGSWEVTAKPLPRARRCRGSRAGSCLQDGAFLANSLGFCSLEPSGMAAGIVSYWGLLQAS